MIPMVLGKLYLSLSLRGDKRNIGGRQKRKKYWGTAGDALIQETGRTDLKFSVTSVEFLN
jgi:hypothetical protein